MPTVWTMHSAFALALVTARLNASCLEEHNKREGGGGGGGGDRGGIKVEENKRSHLRF